MRLTPILPAFILGAITVGSSAEAANYHVVYSFGQGSNSDGSFPYQNLVRVGSDIYGITLEGGAYGGGVVFDLSPKSGSMTVVHSFGQGEDASNPTGLVAVGRALYGTAAGGEQSCSGGCGTVFRILRGSEKLLYRFKDLSDGDLPYGLLYESGLLYGAASSGGSAGFGTLFSINQKTGMEQTLYAFKGAPDGDMPEASPILLNGILYGTTKYGGSNFAGAVYSVNPSTGAEAILHSFSYGDDGANPSSSLTAVNGVLYGTAYSGGAYGYGAVYSVDPTTGAEHVLYSFTGSSDGAFPSAGLVSFGGQLYGTTANGGPANCEQGCGVLYSLDPSNGREEVVHAFGNGNDGFGPAGVLLVVGRVLYGTTGFGGTYNLGTVFTFQP